jgi:tripartite-type tricarboxylate transporter receptor subunit TctC
MRSLRTLVALGTVAWLAAGSAWSQVWPVRPITVVVPFAADGPKDLLARALSVPSGKALGQTVVVKNKLGAGGTLAATQVARAQPDSYTFLIHHNGMATARRSTASWPTTR